MLPNPPSQTSNLAYTSIRTDPHIKMTNTQPFTNPENILPKPLITPTYKKIQPRRNNLNSQFRLQHILTHLHPFLNPSNPLMVYTIIIHQKNIYNTLRHVLHSH